MDKIKHMNGIDTVEDEDFIRSSFFDWLMAHPNYLKKIVKAKEQLRKKVKRTVKKIG